MSKRKRKTKTLKALLSFCTAFLSLTGSRRKRHARFNGGSHCCNWKRKGMEILKPKIEKREKKVD